MSEIKLREKTGGQDANELRANHRGTRRKSGGAKMMTEKKLTGIWRNKESGVLYCATGIIFNATNAGLNFMVKYRDGKHEYCRDYGEFMLKFEPVKTLGKVKTRKAGT